jgi:hypothetical protein
MGEIRKNKGASSGFSFHEIRTILFDTSRWAAKGFAERSPASPEGSPMAGRQAYSHLLQHDPQSY